MRVLVVRHAIAEDRDVFAKTGKPDTERPLTAEGTKRMEAAARGLARIVPTLDVVASSPLVRARQTAEVIAAAYGGLVVAQLPLLKPTLNADAVIRWLNDQADGAAVAVVGHEPDMGMLVSYLLTGVDTATIEMKKGAVCLLEFDGAVAAGDAVLRWFLAPKHLRAIGAARA